MENVPMSATTLLGGVVLLLIVIFAMRSILLRQVDQRTEALREKLEERERAEHALAKAHKELANTVHEQASDLAATQEELIKARTALTAANEKLNTLARVDSLTNIPNRACFDETLDEEIKRTVRDRKPLSALLCEIDCFEEFNTTEGAERGDEILRRVAEGIDDTFRRAGDLVARYSGARFGVVLPATDEAAATRFAEKLRKAVWDLCIPFEKSSVADRISVSVGFVSVQPDRLHEASALMAASEEALTQAQEKGCNRVQVA